MVHLAQHVHVMAYHRGDSEHWFLASVIHVAQGVVVEVVFWVVCLVQP
jgi:hypothetical protein